jgi:hypothetical protein
MATTKKRLEKARQKQIINALGFDRYSFNMMLKSREKKALSKARRAERPADEIQTPGLST